MVAKFDELNAKIKYIFGLKTDIQVAKLLNLSMSTYKSKKKKDEIPYDQVIEACINKNVDLNWILNLKNS